MINDEDKAVLDKAIKDCHEQYPNFMKGYHRDPDMVDRLVEAIREALYAHPEQRLGQLIDNYLYADQVNLFYVQDEDFLHALNRASGKIEG